MSIRKALFLAACALSAAPAGAEMKPSSPQAIASAVADCWQAANATALDEAALKARGWQSAALKTPGGGPVAAEMRFLAKPGADIVMMVSKSVDPRGCTITSRVESVEAITTAAREIYKAVQPLEPKLEVKQPTPAEVAFFALPKVALLRPGGSKDKPAVNVQVGYTAPEKK